MSDPRLKIVEPFGVAQPSVPRTFGRHLVDSGLISQQDLIHALDLQRRIDAQLGDILVAEGLLPEDAILATLARQHSAQRVDLEKDPPAPDMAQSLPAALCLKHGTVSWAWIGKTLLVATSQPGRFGDFCACMGQSSFTMLPVIASAHHIQAQLNRLYGDQLALKAASRVPNVESCRGWGRNTRSRAKIAALVCIFLVICVTLAPVWMLTAGVLWAALTLILTTGIKLAAFIAQTTSQVTLPIPKTDTTDTFKLPRVSIMVPLLHEREIAGALIKRLSRLTYPKSLLNVVLVLEAKDKITRDTIARTTLPTWISVIEVPDAEGPTTKPRALNYALDFCRGSIIGIWDAEDAPEPDQIEKVVMRFHEAPKNVVCLQGILDYYNSRHNWLSRCFTIEYATWWRLVLPGLAKLGLVIPLGGTTLFFKRDILEELGGWDAHNVTEDADLGVRLARHGYVTELIPTVTMEEANCRAWPWVRQRSRWLKGFMITYFVHMRAPVQLIRELGFARFLGLQMLFLASFSQFVLAPLLWSFWITVFGYDHPVEQVLAPSVMTGVFLLFFASEILSLAMGFTAVSGPKHRHLLAWVPTMSINFILGAFASYKALYEMALTPFYWDKTEHGVTQQSE